MYAFILVIKAIIGTGGGPSAEKADHIVLVQLRHTAIFLCVFVIIVKFAGIAIRCDRFLLVFHKIPPIQSVCPIIISKNNALGKGNATFSHIHANPKQAGKKPSAKCASAQPHTQRTRRNIQPVSSVRAMASSIMRMP